MAKTVIQFKFKKSIGFPGPNGGILSPKIYPHQRETPHFGQVPVHKYHFDEDVYPITLLEEEREIPVHIKKLGPEAEKAWMNTYAKKLAENHEANNDYREILKQKVADGTIELISDSFLDTKKDEKPAPPTVVKAEKKAETKE